MRKFNKLILRVTNSEQLRQRMIARLSGTPAAMRGTLLSHHESRQRRGNGLRRRTKRVDGISEMNWISGNKTESRRNTGAGLNPVRHHPSFTKWERNMQDENEGDCEQCDYPHQRSQGKLKRALMMLPIVLYERVNHVSIERSKSEPMDPKHIPFSASKNRPGG